MQLTDFHFHLPSELIARYPLTSRSSSRLLCLDKQSGQIEHKQFNDLPLLLQKNDLLVLNNTKVIPARMFGNKLSGGRVEILLERILDQKRFLAQIRASKSPRPGTYLQMQQNIQFEVIGRQQDWYELYCPADRPVLEIIEMIGEIPLPPYFHRAPEESDKERYQTVFAEHKGSVAAPTAGLHFDLSLLQILKAQDIEIGYVTLHVGAGTFAPVRVEHIEDHRMHSEFIQVSADLCAQIQRVKQNGGRVIAVGTTSARSLETVSRSGIATAYSGYTDIFIYPGFQFNCIDALITNFHLPSSTLLMLVSALGGYEHVMRAYQEAIQKQYRFFSYGDAMFIK